ncbi:MAG: DUF6382 domain-containing protein [Syntrophomonadaceae bacterium]
MEVGRELSCDFVDHNGYYLLISREGGLVREELNPIQVNMLQSNLIPRHLQMEIEEFDLQSRLCYDISGKRALANIIRGRGLKKDEFTQVLLNLLSAIENSAEYMLTEDNYLLESNYIFIGNDISDVYLVYVPLQNPGHKRLYNSMVKLVQDMGAAAGNMDRQELNRILAWLQDRRDGFNARSFKQFLSSYYNTMAGAAPVFPQQNQVKAEVAASHDQPAPRASVLPPQPPDPPQQSKVSRQKPPQANRQTPTGKSTGELSERTRVIIACIAFVVVAFIWKTYTTYPQEGFLYLSIGLSLLVADAVYLLFTLWRPAVESDPESAAAPIPSVKQKGKKMKSAPAAIVTPASTIAPPMAAGEASAAPNQDYYQGLRDKTSLLGSKDETELLHRSTMDIGNVTRIQAWLEVNRGGRIERIPVRGTTFTIGRNPQAVQLVEQASGVSRVHCSIVSGENGWGLKDLDSKNKTYLNGKALIPNKVTPLCNGDCIRVADIEYIFVTGSEFHG